ncbi:tRNA (N(6)-L-threonylcarbamoyladenosine(37)-C(2))-methylthiotransferase MtaB [Hyphococcus sp.]|uniref:tRNA (N(6)-L-threonylcarbamoyladenosine(37)-C(2))- methylthiotransferase MtaB n=1 Tax=Hyphococcus sp. TaxID=2038636 RepID=UPI00207D8A1E|nr:MAG: tRNA (N(6)-L-threonylcarbamoyladenosine(37)-C(2))-methylthiotran sferase MtaB [Marinicaulis sp.]
MTQSSHIVTFGCRLNAAESETIRRLAADAGCNDATIINTCAVTNEAVRSARQRIRRMKRERPNARIIVTGCAAQTEPGAFAAMPEVAAVLGNQEKLDAGQWRALSQPLGQAANDIIRVNDIMSARDTAGHMIDGYGDRARAFLQIQNGCDHRCTFCIIPYGRGNSRSAPIVDVVEQAQRLVDAGHRELVLTGVDITSYGADLDGAPALGALIAALLDQVPDLYRLRLSSIDGAEIDDQLFERIVTDRRVAPHLHLSLQAGDNMILKRMKRRHTREQAIELCASIRAARPDVAFGADIIAGFPTETEEMFQNSLKIVDEAGLSYLHVFPFSPRQGTPAARMPQLPRAEVKSRAARLRAVGEAALHGFLDSLTGREEDAILESGGRARLGNFAVVNIGELDAQIGEVVRLRIVGRAGAELIGAAA